MPDDTQPGLPKVQRKPLDWGFIVVATLSIGSMIWVTLRDGIAVSQHLLAEDFWLFLTILPKVALGCLIGGLIRLMVARETIEKYIGEGSGVKGWPLPRSSERCSRPGPSRSFRSQPC